MGASVAHHLATRGCRNVLVLERYGRPGDGSTSRATGGFRLQFGSAIHVRLSALSREKLLRFRDETGVDPGYRPCGYLFIVRDETNLRALRGVLEVQREAGVDAAREVGPDEIRRMVPWAHTDEVVGGTFGPMDGFIRPLEILRGYLETAQRAGVRVEYEAGWVECMVRDEGGRRRITGVRAADREIATRCVVNAAGPWAGVFAARAGADVPVRPLKRNTGITHPFPKLSDDTPMTICHWDGVHMRVRDGRVLLLWPTDPPPGGPPNPFDTTFDQQWLEELLPLAYTYFPILREAQIDRARCWAGLYEMSPDRHAILGAAPGIEGLYLINGSSGHGVMHSPALGHLLAEIILDGRASALDATPLRPSRFAEGRPNPRDDVL
ncbi:MAG TPA: FAD-binding oxidoreductase [bacterium]|nr:FAD-binding oxidoreductase [bacterium]